MTAREIVAALTLRGMRQTEIAKRLGVSKTMVNHVIYGRSTSRRIKCYIARLIGEDVDMVWPRQIVA